MEYILIFYVVKKNKVYYYNTLCIGLKKRHDYVDNLPMAKFYEKEENAIEKAKQLNEEKTLPHIRGQWKVKKVLLEEI